jgi:hypothetical protein
VKDHSPSSFERARLGVPSSQRMPWPSTTTRAARF